MRKSLLALALAAPLAFGAEVFHDFGTDADVSIMSSMWINVDEPDWSALWYHSDDEMTANNFAFSECEDHFHWVSSGHQGEVTSRGMKFRKKTIVYVGGNLPDDQDLYVTIRYKDNLLEPLTVVSGSASFTIGGESDHKWKTEQFRMSAGRLQADNLSFRFGQNYTNDMSGILHIDMMQVSTSDDMDRFPQDAQGHWPVPAQPNQFANIRDTNVYHPGGEPFFPFGTYTGMAFALQKGDESFSEHAKDSFKIFEDAKFNTLVLHGWGNDWGSSWKQWDNEWPWAAPLVYTELGFDEYIAQAEFRGLKVVVNPVLDTRAFRMNELGGETKVDELFEDLIDRYKDNPTILAWNPVDEWDHEDVGYGKPHVQSQKWYQLFKDGDPSTPVYTSLMGFHGPLAWDIAQQSTDILANDRYFDDSSDHDQGAKDQHRYMMQIREHNKGRIAIPKFASNKTDMGSFPPLGIKRMPNETEIVWQAYYNITAGAQGLLYFTNEHPDNTSYYINGVTSAWDGMRRVGEELFGDDGIAHALIAPSITVDIMGEEGIVEVLNREIYTILKKDKDGDYYLITVNMSNESVTTMIRVNGMPDGQYEVRFEGRNANASDGFISDTWGARERHVYIIKDGSPPPVDPPPIDPCDIFPWHPDCTGSTLPPGGSSCDINRAR